MGEDPKPRSGVPERRGADDKLEHDVRAACARGAFDEAASIVVRRMGGELLRFLVHAHRDEDKAADVFSLLAEDIWRGLPGFRWDCSFRTWAYCLARRASSRHRRRNAGEERHVVVPLAELGSLSEIVLEVRTRTLSAIRTERRTALEQLRDELDVEERMLLSLRIDRELSWPEVASILAEGEGQPDATDIARLRKRFQLLKDRLKKRGRELGLVPAGRSPS
ncbi:MAG: sigma-70 family RNA polymerase sigma factor [Deltaproteobacteria bacterium]|nr:sigma-70 family RNA polymerase sigma factor [Deltaproteobacteria bacterium]